MLKEKDENQTELSAIWKGQNLGGVTVQKNTKLPHCSLDVEPATLTSHREKQERAENFQQASLAAN